MRPVLTIIFETHAWSEDNEHGIATGWLPGELSPKGRILARELGERRRNDGIQIVVTSDLARATETARVAFAGTALPSVEDARLRECNYGDLNGAPVERLHGRRTQFIDHPYPNGQSYREVERGVRSFLIDYARSHPGGKLLVIGHSATRWSLDSLIDRKQLQELVDAPFDWRPGWNYTLSSEDLVRLQASID